MVFRPYDIRGVADRDLKDELVQKIGRGLGRMLRRGGPEGAPPRIVVGRDCRASGPRLFDALVHGLVDGGVDVIDVGVGPTPLMYFGVRSLDADGGVMITGGHDPKEINGFKITRSSGRFVGEDLEKLEAWVAGAPPPLGIQGSLETIMVEDGYLDRLEKLELADPGMKVVVDAGNGAAGPIALRALRGLGITPTALNCRMDGSFPNHDPDPLVAENLAQLAGAVRAQNARVGVAWDGDGDTLGVVDANGAIVAGERLLALFASEVLRENPGATVIVDARCSLSKADGVVPWTTGRCPTPADMREHDALFAGDARGHFCFRDHYLGFDDAIYAAVRLLNAVSARSETPSQGDAL